MEKLVIALGPAFAAGFAVQQLLEILDPSSRGDSAKRVTRNWCLACCP